MLTIIGRSPRRVPGLGPGLSKAALLSVLAIASPAAAEIPERTTNLLVYGDDPCPSSTDEEVVVCARRPENERYRIPKPLRDKERRTDPASTSWASHWAGVEDMTRYTRPDSCSPVGSFGFTGCTQAMLRQWWQERRAAGSTQP
ncbi:MAG: hypothetical protein QOH81_3032 [Sphingomonadales bacterium]|jgi:hypothetical protein|nr:hypothetical protein [Sphingomonadales bacterium]